MTEPAALSLHGVTKSFGTGAARVAALRGATLEVRPGELLMLVGPSGCGKTTLISVAAGILNRDEGQCSVFGTDLQALSDRERVRYRGRHIGFVFQLFNLLPTLDVVDNVAVPLLLNGRPRAEAVRQAREILTRVGLGERLSAYPSQLSGGQQQRVAIARALVHQPRLIVCDEPTSALDHDTGRAIMELLRRVALAEGRSLVIVTHDPRIFEFADRIARMDDGRIVQIADSPSRLN